MIRIVTFHPRRADHASVSEHWRSYASPLVAPGQAVERSIAWPSQAQIPGVPSSPFDGAVESSWFDTAADAAAAYGAASMGDLAAEADAANRWACETNTMIGPRTSYVMESVKVMAFLRRRPDISYEAFQEHWRDRHAPLVAGLPHVLRYAQTQPLAEHYRSGRQPLFDGIAELWWPTLDAVSEAWRSPQMEIDNSDMAHFSGGGLYFFLAEERTQ